MALDYLPFMDILIVYSLEALLFLEQRFERTDALPISESARFKIFVDYQVLTISQFSGWGKGNVAQNKDNFTGSTEGKLCHMKRGL